MLALEAATMPSQRDVAETYRAFGEHGYEARVPATLDIAWFGVPQSRALTIILAAREDMSLPPLPSATTSPEDHLSLPLFASVPQGPTVNEAIGNLAMLEKGRIDLTRNDRIVLDAAELAEFDRLASDFTQNLRRRSAEDYSYERTWNPALLTNVKTETPMLDVLLRYSRTTPGNIEPTSGLRRLNGASAAVSLGPSVLGEGFARPIHPTFARRISTREAARIQAFPDWFLFQGIADYEFTYVANSVSPRFARELGATLLRHLRQEPISPTRALTRRVGGTRSVFVAA
jgi:DNA (cytosine-5)-methyltransferase 1